MNKKLKKEYLIVPAVDETSSEKALIVRSPGKRPDQLNIARCPTMYIRGILTPKDNSHIYRDYNCDVLELKDIFDQKKFPTPTSSDSRILLTLIKNERNGIINIKLTELASISGVHRTNVGTSLKRLAEGLYIGKKAKNSKTVIYSKEKFIEIVSKNTYRILLASFMDDNSFSRIDIDILNSYLKFINNNKQLNTATDFYFYYVRILTSSNKGIIKRLFISELEITVFAKYKYYRNEYKSFLQKCLEGLIHVGYLEEYKFEKGNRGEQISLVYPMIGKKLRV